MVVGAAAVAGGVAVFAAVDVAIAVAIAFAAAIVQCDCVHKNISQDRRVWVSRNIFLHGKIVKSFLTG